MLLVAKGFPDIKIKRIEDFYINLLYFQRAHGTLSLHSLAGRGNCDCDNSNKLKFHKFRSRFLSLLHNEKDLRGPGESVKLTILRKAGCQREYQCTEGFQRL